MDAYEESSQNDEPDFNGSDANDNVYSCLSAASCLLRHSTSLEGTIIVDSPLVRGLETHGEENHIVQFEAKTRHPRSSFDCLMTPR